MKFNINEIPFDDVKTWDLIKSGYNVGIFQLESNLFHAWLKKVKPNNIWELSILIALLRPGPLMSGYADNYLQYRNAPESIESIGHPIIDEIVQSTGGVIVYQEQIMFLGARLAWSNLPPKERDLKVDILRKAIGKKNQQKILEIGKEFVEGCAKNKIDTELADKLFDLIKNSGRYAFNLSHSITYAHVAYKTAYLKCHYPMQFYCTYLSYAKFKLDKWEELAKIVNECKVLGQVICPPNFNLRNSNFMIYNDSIIYGLSHMKYGPNSKTIASWEDKIPRIVDWKTFCKLLCHVYNVKIRSNTMEALISSGAFDDTKLTRKVLLNIYKFIDTLTDKEVLKIIPIIDEVDTLEQFIEQIKFVSVTFNGHRKATVTSNLQFLKLDEYNNPQWIESMEKNYLGINITACGADDKTFYNVNQCKECSVDWPLYTKKKLAVVLDQVIMTTTKKGQNPGQKMARINVHDNSSSLSNLPVFPDKYMEYSDLLRENNTLLLDIFKNKNGWCINTISQI